MRKLTGSVFRSLDDVMQAPGGPTEDWTGGFKFGGWTVNYWDEAGGKVMEGLFAAPFDLLLGRKTYDIFAAYWPFQGPDSEIGQAFDRVNKYVVTHSDAPLEWQNSHRLGGIDAVAEVKASEGPDLLIQGSSTLYPQLLAAGLIDRLLVMTFPVVLGGGKRLFGEGTPPLALRLVDHEVTSTGVMVGTYEPAGAVTTGTFATQEPSEAERARQEKMKREG